MKNDEADGGIWTEPRGKKSELQEGWSKGRCCSRARVREPIRAYEPASERYGPGLENESARAEFHRPNAEVWCHQCRKSEMGAVTNKGVKTMVSGFSWLADGGVGKTEIARCRRSQEHGKRVENERDMGEGGGGGCGHGHGGEDRAAEQQQRIAERRVRARWKGLVKSFSAQKSSCRYVPWLRRYGRSKFPKHRTPNYIQPSTHQSIPKTHSKTFQTSIAYL